MMQFISVGFYTIVFGFVIYKFSFFRLPGISPLYTVLLFLLKIISATVIWQWYQSYYPVSDSHVFLQSAELLYQQFFDQPLTFFRLFLGFDNPETASIRDKMVIWNPTEGIYFINDARTMIRLHTLIRFFSMGYFYVHAVFMCFLSFIGLSLLYKTFYPYLIRLRFFLIVILFLFPSVLFWSSGLLKEGIVFLGLGLLLYHTQCGLRKQYTTKTIIGAILGTLLLVYIKFYVLIALFPGLIANSWISVSNHKKIILKYLSTYSLLLLLFILFSQSSHSFNPINMLLQKQVNFINMAKGGTVIYNGQRHIYFDYNTIDQQVIPVGATSYKLKQERIYRVFKPNQTDTVLISGNTDTTVYKLLYSYSPAGSAYKIDHLKPSVLDLTKRIPLAFFEVLFIPSIYGLNRPFSNLIALENSVLLLLSVILLWFFLKKKFPLAIVLFCFSFFMLLFSIIGLTTPILGAVVRYRIPGIPFLLIGIITMLDEGKLMQWQEKIKKRIVNHRNTKVEL